MTSATVTPVAKVRQAVTMTVSPSWRQEHSDAAAEKGSLRVSRSGDPSWLPISDEDEGSRCSRADFRNESGSAGATGGWSGALPAGLPLLPTRATNPLTAGLASPGGPHAPPAHLPRRDWEARGRDPQQGKRSDRIPAPGPNFLGPGAQG